MKKQRQSAPIPQKKANVPPVNKPAASSGKAKPRQETPSPGRAILLGKQLLIALLGLFLLVQTKKSSDSYTWMYDGLLKGNLESILKRPNASIDERYAMKLGFTMTYFNHVKTNTPDTAIILFPNYEVFADTKNPQQDLSGMGHTFDNKYGYFRMLQPRKVVFEKEKGKSPYFEKITHVAIINGWGYDYLEEPIPAEFQANMAILPIKNSTR